MQMIFGIFEDKEYGQTANFLCKYCSGISSAMSSEMIANYLGIPEKTVNRHIFKAVRDGQLPILHCSKGFYVPNNSEELKETI